MVMKTILGIDFYFEIRDKGLIVTIDYDDLRWKFYKLKWRIEDIMTPEDEHKHRLAWMKAAKESEKLAEQIIKDKEKNEA